MRAGAAPFLTSYFITTHSPSTEERKKSKTEGRENGMTDDGNIFFFNDIAQHVERADDGFTRLENGWSITPLRDDKSLRGGFSFFSFGGRSLFSLTVC